MDTGKEPEPKGLTARVLGPAAKASTTGTEEFYRALEHVQKLVELGADAEEIEAARQVVWRLLPEHGIGYHATPGEQARQRVEVEGKEGPPGTAGEEPSGRTPAKPPAPEKPKQTAEDQIAQLQRQLAAEQAKRGEVEGKLAKAEAKLAEIRAKEERRREQKRPGWAAQKRQYRQRRREREQQQNTTSSVPEQSEEAPVAAPESSVFSRAKQLPDRQGETGEDAQANAHKRAREIELERQLAEAQAKQDRKREEKRASQKRWRDSHLEDVRPREAARMREYRARKKQKGSADS